MSRFGLLAAGAGLLFAPPIVGRTEPAAIRVGQTEALTGPSSAYGIRAGNGAKLEQERVNKSGFVIGGTT
jgi:ABC-type branched-subunit amino acid transport system substrate-binding protein